MCRLSLTKAAPMDQSGLKGKFKRMPLCRTRI
jgi:hypothetical protein